VGNEWLIEQLSLESPLFWLALSVLTLPLVYVLARRVPPRAAAWIAVMRWVLIPYMGLMLGGLSPRFLGLSKINWATTLSLGMVVLFAALAAGAAIRIALLAEARSGETSIPALSGEAQQPWRWSGVLLAVFWIGAEQFHWCFVRGAIWETLLINPEIDARLPAYRAMWLATLVILPEIWLQPGDLARHLLKAAILVVSAVAFFYTRNFWLCWVISAGLWLLIAGPTSSVIQGMGSVRPDFAPTPEA
jgi:hypothetical protein